MSKKNFFVSLPKILREQYVCVVVALLSLSFQISVHSEVIPAERLIQWRNKAGVAGGIPVRSNIRDCVINDGAHADGRDTAPNIQACIDNAPVGGVAYIPAGVYVLASPLIIKSNKTLRGAGPDKTILLADDIANVIQVGREMARKPAINILSGYTKGSSVLELADAAYFNAGCYITLDELNDSEIPVTNSGYGVCTWCGRDNGARVRAQIAKVVSKNGNQITIDPPMYFTFKAENIPQAQRAGENNESGMYSVFSGIEDLTISNNWRPDKVKGSDGKEYRTFKSHTSSEDNRPVTGSDWKWYWSKTNEGSSNAPDWMTGRSYNGDYSNSRIPLKVSGTAHCWAKNIRIENCGARCVYINYNNYGFEFRDSHIKNCINRQDSNNCYGTLIGSYSSGILIENNIFESLADGPMFAWNASGNVVGYNYMYDCHRTQNQSTWFTAFGGSHHGAHTSYNLWEGNEAESICFDYYWGSHSHNTLFRNRVLGKYMVEGIAVDRIQAVNTVATEKNIHYQSYLGNVLGSSGYHDYYERNAEGCPNAHYDKLIYRTGYVSGGSCELPPLADTQTFATMLRHMNYDFVSRSVKYCGDAGEPGCQGGDGARILPDSLYLDAKPVWYGAYVWPPFGPVGPEVNLLPAKDRFLNAADLSIGEPNPPTRLIIR